MGNSAVPALLLAGGAYLLLRPDPATGQSPLGSLISGGASDSQQGAPSDGGLGDLPLSPYDPQTGLPTSPFDPFTGAPLTPYDPNAPPLPGYDPGPAPAPREPGFFARAFSPENLGFGAILAAPAIFRGTPAAARAIGTGAARAGSAVVRGATTAARATGQAASRVVPRAATAARFATTGAAGVATGVAGGLAVGQGAVTVLQRTGALDAVARTAQRANVSTPQRQAIQAATAPLQYVGAISTGLAGRGSVSSNVREVNQAVAQTAQRAVVQPVQAAARATTQAVRNASPSNFRSGVSVLRRRLF